MATYHGKQRAGSLFALQPIASRPALSLKRKEVEHGLKIIMRNKNSSPLKGTNKAFLIYSLTKILVL